MVALLVVATILVFLTIDLWVQRAALRTVPGVPLILPRTIPSEARVDTAHNWVRPERGGLTVGADGLAAALLGRPALTSWLRVGAHVRKGDPMVTLRQNERSVDLPSPVDGVVVARNEMLRRDPEAARQDPFGSGWLYRLEPDSGTGPPRGRGGHEAAGWMRSELRRLREVLGSLSQEGLVPVPTLPDGGTPAAGLAAEMKEETWKTLAEAFFSYGPQPVPDPSGVEDGESSRRTS